jgi:selenocysteine lyase/cysteine desulfurase
MGLNIRLTAVQAALLSRVYWVKQYIGSLQWRDEEGYAELAKVAMEAFDWLCAQVQNTKGPSILTMQWPKRAGTVAVTAGGNVCIMLPSHKDKQFAAQAILAALGEQFALYPAENVWYVVLNGEEPFTLTES